MTIAFFVLLVLFVWVCVMLSRSQDKLSALQRDYDNMVKAFWARNEEFSKLKVRANDLETVLEEMLNAFPGSAWHMKAHKALGRTISDPAQRVLPLDEKLRPGKDFENFRKALDAQLLPDLPPGVDTAAQVPPRCRHCGRFKENHDKHTKALDCLPTLMPDGRLVESQTHFEPLPPLPPNPPPQPTPDRRREPIIKIPSAKVEIFICPGCGYPVASCHCQS